MGRRGDDRAAAKAALPLRLFSQTRDRIADDSNLADVSAAAFEASAESMAIVDREGRLLHINAAGAALFPAALCGRKFSDVLTLDARLAIETALAQALTGGAPAKIECQPAANGPWMEIRVTGFRYEDAWHALISARDIEVQRQIAEQLRRAISSEALGRLAGGLAHDFNNLLTVVIGNSELLGERLAHDPELRQLAQTSLAAALAGADLARLLVASARPQGQQAEFCVAQMIRDLGGLLERSLGPGIVLEIEAPADGWSVRTDRALLASVLLNLVLNAKQAMPCGGTLVLQARNDSDSEEAAALGDCVEIIVRDTGQGIPAALLERVFDPFFTTRESGTGLGLAMVRSFVDQVGGRIAIRSQMAQGTAVHLYLPRAAVQLGLPHLEEEAGLRARDGESVLIACEGALRETLKGQLHSLGYATADMEVGRLTEFELATQQASLTLVDLAALGDQAGKIVRKLRRLSSHTKFLFLADRNNDASVSKLAGVVLDKPFTRLQLARRLRAAIDERL